MSVTKKKGLVESTIISTIGSLGTRGLGMILTIFISNQIGAEGTGIYQLMMTIYGLAYMLASAGIITTVSRMIAEAISKGAGDSAKKMMRHFFTIGCVMSVAMSTLLFIYATPVSMWVLKDARGITGLKILTISIPFMTISACYKGYFYGVQKVMKPVTADVFEHIIKLILIGVLLTEWAPRGIAYSCIAIAVGVLIGEMLSFVYLAVFYMFDTSMESQYRRKSTYEEIGIGGILKVLGPLALSAYIGGTLIMIENAIIPHGLKASGLNSVEALSAYGIIKGMVMPILFFPAAFLGAGAVILIPEIARAKSMGWTKRVETLTNRVLHFTMILSVFIVAVFGIYSHEIGVMLYNNVLVGDYIRILVCMVPFMYVEMIVDGILKGLGEQTRCLYYRMFDSIARVVLMYLFIPKIGLNAVIIISIAVNVATAVLMLAYLKKVTGIRMLWSKWLNYPMLSAVACTLTSKVIMQYMIPHHVHFNVKMIIALCCATLMHGVFLILLQSITKEDLEMFQPKRVH